MIPDDWQPCRRASDGELTGYLMTAAEVAPEVVPVTLIGTRLGPAQDVDSATALVNQYGLAELAEYWWCRLPDPLTSHSIDVAAPQDDWTWRRVVVVEASPAALPRACRDASAGRADRAGDPPGPRRRPASGPSARLRSAGG